MTRKDYMAGRCSHLEYYSQFVTPSIKTAVARKFDLEKLTLAYIEDENLNNIPLKEWDSLPILTRQVNEAYKQAGDFPTIAGLCCIAKTAAVMLIFNIPCS